MSKVVASEYVTLLEQVDSKTLNSGIIILTYQPAPPQ